MKFDIQRMRNLTTGMPEPTKEDRADMLKRYGKMPNPLADKEVIVVEK